MTELKNSIDDFNSRGEEGEERISKLEDRSTKIIQLQEQKEKRMKGYEKSPQEDMETISRNNVCITGVPEGEERKKIETLLK